MNIGIITGASSGIGKEFVFQINNKYKTIDEIWIIARREDKLLEVKNSIKDKKVRIIVADLSKSKDIENISELFKREKPNIRILVNSAGYGMIEEFSKISKNDNSGMIDVNCRGLCEMTYISIPYMKKNSQIINIASSAGFIPQPSFLVYGATKAFVIHFSRGLNAELCKKGIYVLAVCPGPVDTEFFEVAEKYKDSQNIKTFFRVKTKKVVKKALNDAYYKKDVSVYGIFMKSFRVLSKIFPHKILIKIVNKFI